MTPTWCGLAIGCAANRSPSSRARIYGQAIGLPYLVPLALEQLTDNPLIAGDMYPGDLLQHVLGVRPEFWQANPGLGARVDFFVFTLEQMLSAMEGAIATYKLLNLDEKADPD